MEPVLMDELVLVLTTEANQAKAEALANQLLVDRLAACIALQPLRSKYLWQGRMEQAEEVQLLIKTLPSRAAALRQAVLKLHSYATPQWIEWQARCSHQYGAWLDACCGLSSDGVAPDPEDSLANEAPAG